MMLDERARDCARALRAIRTFTLALLVAGFGSVAHGATFTVNSTADAVDASPGNGICASAGGACTLRGAIQEANALSGSHTIDLPAGTYALTLAGAGENAGATGDLDIPFSSSILIQGAGESESIIDGGLIDRVLDVAGGLSLNSLTVRRGSAGDSGGGISSSGSLFAAHCIIEGNSAGNDGGGIFTTGTVELRSSTVRNNLAGGRGGGVAKSGFSSFDLIDSTVAGNEAGSGGGLRLENGFQSLVNSTVSGNHAYGDGGGVLVNDSTIAIIGINNVTFTSNVADYDENGSGDGGGLAVTGSSHGIDVSNTILADNVDRGGEAPDCKTFGAGISGRGYNLLGDPAGCTLDVGSDLTGNLTGPALLGPLAANGVPTDTHLPLPGSPVRNAGNPAAPGSGPYTCVTFDQRGFFRPFGPACDIGAVEAGPLCGDGTLDDGEECDDGNTADLDCCSSTCQAESSELPCDADDGDPCTHEFCNGAGACEHRATPWPELYCQSGLPGKATLALNDKTPDTRDKVAWKYSGDGVPFFALVGAPEPAVFCIYDKDGIVLRAAVPGDSMCAGKPCWTYKEPAALARFKDKTAAIYGAHIIQSKGALSPKGKALFKGKGEALDFVPPPWSGTVVAELTNSVQGLCYTTRFTTPKKNVTGQYSAKGN